MKKKLVTILAMGYLVFSIVGAANAALIYSDDFEDSNTVGWNETILSGRGGSGSTGVKLNNGSLMAFVYHQGNGEHSLSRDFVYAADNHLSFDMQAVATLGYSYSGSPLNSYSGVVVSFLNLFNSSIGSIAIANAAIPNSLGSDFMEVENGLYNYSATMSDFATYAGLSASDSISKMSLKFFTTATYSWGGNIYPNGISSSTVWFDNVTVSDTNAVPVPGAVWLLGSGLVGLVGLNIRNKQA